MAKTMILNQIFITYLSLIIPLISISTSDPSTGTSPITGFSVDLIYRDSPQSPTYDPSITSSQRLAHTLKRSFSRLAQFELNPSKKAPPSPDITNSNGEYLLKYSIGTPPLPSLGIADTGSDVLWTQCKPCLQCFKQYLPIFNPNTSSTYQRIPCNSPKCKSLKETLCSKTRQNCLFTEKYGDGSFANGELATDTITLDNGVSIPNVTLGCGFKNGGIFSGGESGIVGLGRGKTSLISQLGPLAQGKFSYCLVSLSDTKNSSKLNFGSNAEVSGREVVSTPLIKKKVETFYYLTLEGISVGNQRVEFRDPSSDNLASRAEGNIIIDSGTTALLLPFDFYAKLETELKKSIKLKQVKDPLGVFQLCYFSKDDNIQMPEVTAHFKGADVKLRTENVFVRTGEDSLCFAASSIEGGAIYGNLAQVNFLVGYDLVKGTVSFKPTDCGK